MHHHYHHSYCLFHILAANIIGMCGVLACIGPYQKSMSTCKSCSACIRIAFSAVPVLLRVCVFVFVSVFVFVFILSSEEAGEQKFLVKILRHCWWSETFEWTLSPTTGAFPELAGNPRLWLLPAVRIWNQNTRYKRCHRKITAHTVFVGGKSKRRSQAWRYAS